jgi:hypothetical protein
LDRFDGSGLIVRRVVALIVSLSQWGWWSCSIRGVVETLVLLLECSSIGSIVGLVPLLGMLLLKLCNVSARRCLDRVVESVGLVELFDPWLECSSMGSMVGLVPLLGMLLLEPCNVSRYLRQFCTGTLTV